MKSIEELTAAVKKVNTDYQEYRILRPNNMLLLINELYDEVLDLDRDRLDATAVWNTALQHAINKISTMKISSVKKENRDE